MSVAERTREAVDERPFLYEALRAGVVNYTAAARFLDLGDEEAVAAALRRYAGELADADRESGDARVRMVRGVGRLERATDPDSGTLIVGETAFEPGAGTLTGVLATGEVATTDVHEILGRCAIADVAVEAAGLTDEQLALVVGGRAGADALRIVEDVLGG